MHTAISAVMELVNELYKHPEADLAARVRNRDRRFAAVPVRASPGR